MSSTSPSLSTARHSRYRLPAIETAIGSRCHVKVGQGAAASTRGEQRAELEHPVSDRLVRDVEPSLGEQILGVAITQGEAQVKPNRILS
jgi:hypothetical protein